MTKWSASGSWRYVRRHCALPDVRFYDCRHSFASWLAMGGATELEIAAQLGHNNVQTTRRYVHLGQDHLRRNAGIMETVIESAIAETNTEQLPIVAHRDRRGTIITKLEPQTLPPIDGEG